MDIFPIWKTVFWESEEDSITFRIMKWGTEEIYRARAARFPDTETLSVNLNKPCQNTLDSALFRTSPTGDTVELSNAYAEYSLQVLNPSNGEWSAEYQWAFVNDWSYAAHEGDVYSEPINGHAAAGQILTYSYLSSGGGETICYDEQDIGPHISVVPSTIYFDCDGGTATITVTSTAPWTATVNGNIQISQVQGGAGTTTITVTCGENLNPNDRYYTVYFTASKNGITERAVLTVIQDKADLTPEEYRSMYLTLEAETPGTIGWEVPENASAREFMYSTDNGSTWNYLSVSGGQTRYMGDFNRGDTILLKYNTYYSDWFYYAHFVGTAAFKVYGNIMSLLYGDNFTGKYTISLNDAFEGLFHHSNVTSAKNLQLPATTLSENCYAELFWECPLFKKAPTLPATTLSEGCYWSMFHGCTALETAPALPATTLAPGCYTNMFSDCTALKNTPELPAETATARCYAIMFAGCTALETAPAIHATTLAPGCYEEMFSGCTALTTAPALPVKTLAEACYNSMFIGCVSLTEAPELPAKRLGDRWVYAGMFKGCSNLQRIKCLATNIEQYDLDYEPTEATLHWVNGVSATGTFIKSSNYAWNKSWTQGDNGIPAGWTVVDA